MMNIHPYLFFNGNCRQAMEFYQKCLGGELQIMTYAEAPENEAPSAPRDAIMHAALKKDNFLLMASDGMADSPVVQGDQVFLSISVESVTEAERVFKALGEKGQVTMPLQQTFWAARFGMITDNFGMKWMINCESK